MHVFDGNLKVSVNFGQHPRAKRPRGATVSLKYLVAPLAKNGPVAQLNSASDFGSEGYRFESCRGHEVKP